MIQRSTANPQKDRNIPGWWYTYPSEKYDFVSWGDDIPNIWIFIKVLLQSPPTRYRSVIYCSITGLAWSTSNVPMVSSCFFLKGHSSFQGWHSGWWCSNCTKWCNFKKQIKCHASRKWRKNDLATESCLTCMCNVFFCRRVITSLTCQDANSSVWPRKVIHAQEFTLWQTKIAIEHDPFRVDLSIKNGDFL